MLARKLQLTVKGVEVGTTPMLVPAISSRINEDISKILEIISECVTGPLLISAYDYYHYKMKHEKELEVSFPELIFLDSGGYECNKDKDASDIDLYKLEPKEWSRNIHSQVVKEWSNEIPTVLISYDHPSDKGNSIEKQIENCEYLFHGKNNCLTEILIKPETKDARRIKPENIIKNLDMLSPFDIFGFTEKELGYSVLDRMINLAKIRKAMDDEEIERPIHIFGSLDPITTPLYYISGADIFDGLAWLRFIFDDGNTYYVDSFGPKKFGIHEHTDKIMARTIYENYNYLMRLQLDLAKFQSKEDFDIFGKNAKLIKKAYDDVCVKVEGVT